MKKTFLIFSFFIACLSLTAQTTKEEMTSDINKTGGIYYAYPATKADNTPAPSGYKPFHISHYGRHGSRYLISDNDYIHVADLLHKANSMNALTPLGKNVMTRVDSLMIEVAGRGGDLSPLGSRQHRDIADRMSSNYPEVFKDNAYLTARSTLVPRCILSMTSFTERLKEKNPKLKINTESSQANMYYLCHSIPESDEFKGKNGWWKEAYRKFENKNTNPERFVNSIFSDPVFIDRYVNPHDFMWALRWFAVDSQNTEGKIDFFDLFTEDELFDMWQAFNARFYGEHADYVPADGVHVQNAANLLTNIIETADAAIKMDVPSAALRFGHDGNVVPLVALMQLKGGDASVENLDEVYKNWCDWYVTPMAANIQLIFFKNPKHPEKVLVKFLHNEKETSIPVETDIWPYYDWSKVKDFFNSRMKK